MTTIEQKWRIVTEDFTYVMRSNNFFDVAQRALNIAKERNSKITGVFEIDPSTMRRKISDFEQKRLDKKVKTKN